MCKRCSFANEHLCFYVSNLWCGDSGFDCGLFYYQQGSEYFKALAPTNWATVVLGIVITGLEVGFIQAYKAGWKVSTLATVTNGILAIALIFVGMLLYKEHISWTQILGVFICLIGLILINR
ncbi:hypothetical protein [Treponema sp.]|uniref:hypothetical protein n=1 Tax=Treponema sp. TaxID=166 RepID=UPI00298D64B2|nr:hypothetical protein [Treponema sp.]